jgi:Ca-activated chloride channel homolog
MKRVVFLFLCGTFLTLSKAFSQSENVDKSLSPYFLVKSETMNFDALPLKSTTAEVKIAGMIADVTVVRIPRLNPCGGVCDANESG